MAPVVRPIRPEPMQAAPVALFLRLLERAVRLVQALEMAEQAEQPPQQQEQADLLQVGLRERAVRIR